MQFAAPLPEETRFTITLPKDLKDETGRALANAGSFPLAVEEMRWQLDFLARVGR